MGTDDIKTMIEIAIGTFVIFGATIIPEWIKWKNKK